MDNDTLIAFGGEIKALDDGRIGGYLVRFTGPDAPDLEGDYFTKATDFGFSPGERVRTPVWLHHRQPMATKDGKSVWVKNRIGEGWMEIDDEGVMIEAVLHNAEQYRSVLSELGWSSGTGSHLVERTQKAIKAWHVDSWPLGSDASMTPTPAAGPQLTKVITLKSLFLEAAQDTATDAGAASDDSDDPMETASRAPIKGENIMTEKDETPAQDNGPDIGAILASMQSLADAVKAQGEQIKELATTPVNPIKVAPVVIKTRGDGFAPSFKNWMQTGRDDGLKSFINGEEITLPAELNAAKSTYSNGRSSEKNYKASNDTDMNIGTDADGGYLIPIDMVPDILAKRDETALTARLPLRPIPGIGTTVNYPIDNEADGEFITKAEATAYDRDAPALSEKAFTLVKYTKTIQVSDELMQDSPTNLMAFLSDFVGRGMAKTDNNLLLTEVAAAGATLDTFASATAIAFGEPETIISGDDLAPYLEDDGGAAWVMRSSVLWEINSLVGNARYYSGGLDANGNPRNLLGYPVYHSAKSGATAASTKSVYFGNWRYVGVRYGPGLTFLRNPYLLANSGQVALHFYYRVDFGVLQSEAIGFGVHPSA